MFWHLLLVLLSPGSALITPLLGDDRDRQVLALRQQVLILQRQLGKRPRLSRGARLMLLPFEWFTLSLAPPKVVTW